MWLVNANEGMDVMKEIGDFVTESVTTDIIQSEVRAALPVGGPHCIYQNVCS